LLVVFTPTLVVLASNYPYFCVLDTFNISTFKNDKLLCYIWKHLWKRIRNQINFNSETKSYLSRKKHFRPKFRILYRHFKMLKEIFKCSHFPPLIIAFHKITFLKWLHECGIHVTSHIGGSMWRNSLLYTTICDYKAVRSQLLT